uniref:Uncharacterized protein n=1 Tax=Glossina pallidipes TaxID=7398 RepID=A0A1A9ZD89_GLOPL
MSAKADDNEEVWKNFVIVLVIITGENIVDPSNQVDTTLERQVFRVRNPNKTPKQALQARKMAISIFFLDVVKFPSDSCVEECECFRDLFLALLCCFFLLDILFLFESSKRNRPEKLPRSHTCIFAVVTSEPLETAVYSIEIRGKTECLALVV